jgi:hypothetical protein
MSRKCCFKLVLAWRSVHQQAQCKRQLGFARKDAHLLRHAILIHGEIVCSKPVDEMSFAIAGAESERHQGRFRMKGRGRLRQGSSGQAYSENKGDHSVIAKHAGHSLCKRN